MSLSTTSAVDTYPRAATSTDIFAMGVLIIEVISHQQPIPTEYINVRTFVAYTEYQHRQRYIDQFSDEEKEHYFHSNNQAVSHCKSGRPPTRVKTIHQIYLGISRLVTAKDFL